MGQIVGYTVEEMIGMTGAELVADPEELARAQDLAKKREAGVRSDYEIRMRRKDASEVWLLASGSPVYDDTGRHVGNLGMYFDITKRKQAEEALRESEERLRHIAKTGRIGFVEYNIAKDTGYWSREHHEILGYEPGSQISHEQWLQGVHPVDKDRVMANYARLLDRVRSEGHVEGHRDEYRFIRPDGDTVWIDSDMSADIVRDEPVISGSVRDITKRKQAERLWKNPVKNLIWLWKMPMLDCGNGT